MDIGTAIFLSSLVFATVALYAITKDRWNWRHFALDVGRVLAGLAIGAIVLTILFMIISALGLR
jgi:ABC-type nickel/cobalt efflux system permease component RcnA